MATYEVAISTHKTLDAGVNSTVQLTQQFKAVEVVNRGEDYLFFIFGSKAIAPYDDDTWIIPPMASLIVTLPRIATIPPVTLVSQSPIEFTVQGRT
jgi:hypothetical protein